MSDAPVLLSREGAIAVVTINRPSKLNALDREVLEHLLRTFTELRGASDVRAAILTGAGEKAFVAGADIAGMRAMTTAEAKAFADLGHRIGEVLESLPFPVIAAVNGFALGGGCELAMACDLIYASEKAKFGQPEVNLGVIPGFGGTQRLVRRVGVGKARELVYTGDIIDAAEAHRIGLCEAVLPVAELMAHVRKVAEKIASKGPLAITQAKTVIRRGDPTLPSANELEAQAFAMLFGTADQKEGMGAFVEKRPAKFTGA
ncbi:MAG: enoyl-CoA hydratase/isomerase family protein [Deltaproteobacteria bacterium]|nr:enoyl-CoA hydratase/isomerase family protein [Deltaproteobacteria bacterium]